MKNICPTCKQPFEVLRNGKIYCSDRCRKQAFMERQSSETEGTTAANIGNASIQKNAAPDKNGSNSSVLRTIISSETKNKTVPLNVGELTSIIGNTVRTAMQETLQVILKNKKTERIAEDEDGTTGEERNEDEIQNEKENAGEKTNDSENGTEAENDFLHQNDETPETNEESEDEDSDETTQEEFTEDDEENDSRSGTEDENDEDDKNSREDDDNGTAEREEQENGNNYISNPSSAVTDKTSETRTNENPQLKNKVSVNDSSGKNNLIGNDSSGNDKKNENGTLMRNDSSGNESFTKASTGTLFENDKDDKNENGIPARTIMQDADGNKERNAAIVPAKEEKYQAVRSVFLDNICNIVNDSELKEQFASPKKYFPIEKVGAVKNFITYYRCLLENTLRLSQYSSVASEDLHFLIRGYDYLLNQPRLMEIADQCGHEQVVPALHEELCKIYRRHRGKNHLRLVLSRSWKIDAIATLHDIGESVPLYSFKKLFGSILQGEKSF